LGRKEAKKLEQIMHFSAREEYARLEEASDNDTAAANKRTVEAANKWLRENSEKIAITGRGVNTDEAGFVSILFSYVTK
jgi:hypothetical protein